MSRIELYRGSAKRQSLQPAHLNVALTAGATPNPRTDAEQPICVAFVVWSWLAPAPRQNDRLGSLPGGASTPKWRIQTLRFAGTSLIIPPSLVVQRVLQVMALHGHPSGIQ